MANIKRRSCRVRTNNYSQSQHRRSWSVGGSNVNQVMMKRSNSHLRRLKNITPRKQDQTDFSRPISTSPSSSSAAMSHDRRNSTLVDAETQTLVDDDDDDDDESVDHIGTGSRRSKGDGLESPVQEARDSHWIDSEEDEHSDRELEIQLERNRGRASGSSQHLTFNESPGPSLTTTPHFGIGRRVTVDMSEYKYNPRWSDHHPSIPERSTRSNQDSSTNKGISISTKSFQVYLFLLLSLDSIIMPQPTLYLPE